MDGVDLSADFWDARWKAGETGWDIGHASGPLVEYFEGLEDRDVPVLIPGCGSGYEAAHLHSIGFTEVHVIDISAGAVRRFRELHPDFPPGHVHHGDFFAHQGQYAFIAEQTFFCALPPSLRQRYAEHMHRLLRPGGCLVGVLFHIPLNSDRPPFGGSETEYRALFSSDFQIKRMETCRNSIPPRMGSELWVHLVKGGPGLLKTNAEP